jgi:hypothetical protein
MGTHVERMDARSVAIECLRQGAEVGEYVVDEPAAIYIGADAAAVVEGTVQQLREFADRVSAAVDGIEALQGR